MGETALDLADRLGQAVIGAERWRVAFGFYCVLQMPGEESPADILRSIPAHTTQGYIAEMQQSLREAYAEIEGLQQHITDTRSRGTM